MRDKKRERKMRKERERQAKGKKAKEMGKIGAGREKWGEREENGN